jgi:hypothetical protein
VEASSEPMAAKIARGKVMSMYSNSHFNNAKYLLVRVEKIDQTAFKKKSFWFW